MAYQFINILMFHPQALLIISAHVHSSNDQFLLLCQPLFTGNVQMKMTANIQFLNCLLIIAHFIYTKDNLQIYVINQMYQYVPF